MWLEQLDICWGGMQLVLKNVHVCEIENLNFGKWQLKPIFSKKSWQHWCLLFLVSCLWSTPAHWHHHQIWFSCLGQRFQLRSKSIFMTSKWPPASNHGNLEMPEIGFDLLKQHWEANMPSLGCSDAMKIL